MLFNSQSNHNVHLHLLPVKPLKYAAMMPNYVYITCHQ